MKNIIKLSLLIVLSFIFVLPANAQKKKKKEKHQGPVDKITVQVDGLGCPFCAYGLEKKMQEMEGVKKFEIQMESGLTSFTYPAEKMLTLEAVKEQVDKAGYTPMDLKIERADGKVEHLTLETPEIDYEANQSIEFEVNGNCNMCEGRIERAAMSLYGVSSAEWSKKKKRLKVKYLDTEIQEKDIHFAINEAGYDTEKAVAKKAAYDKLPGCCQYDRMDVKVQFTQDTENAKEDKGDQKDDNGYMPE